MHNLTYADVDKVMSHHPPREEVVGKTHDLMREMTKAWAKAMIDLLPAGREKSLFFTTAQEALMWANASVAIAGGPQAHVTVTTLNEIREDFGVDYGTGSTVL
jgi:hypothetical protein